MINNILANLTDSGNISQHDKYLTNIVDNLTDSDNVKSHNTIKFAQ